MLKSSRYSSPVYSYLSDSCSSLGRLVQHSGRLNELQRKLVDHLGPPLDQHCRIANYADTTLTLHTDSPAWAAKLRFVTPDILNYMRSHCSLHDIRTVRIRVSLPDTGPAPVPRRLKLSQEAADHLRAVALSMTDEGLHQSLLKLSEHRNHK